MAAAEAEHVCETQTAVEDTAAEVQQLVSHIGHLEIQLLAGSLSQAVKYGLKRQLAIAKAKMKKAEHSAKLKRGLPNCDDQTK